MAVVRIKRHLNEEPLDALIVNCKRRKLSNEGEALHSEKPTVLQFAGTLHEEASDDSINSLLKKNNVGDLKQQFKKHSVDITTKTRNEIKEQSRNNRYRVINCFRSHSLEGAETKNEEPTASFKSDYTVYDLESDFNQNSVSIENKNNSEPKYVYDLYYTSSDDFGDAEIGDYVSVCPLNDPLVFGSTKENGLDTELGEYDSEDSNAENNWKNDYPDESDMESINEDDMIEAMKKVNINEDLLSSDEGDEDFVYCIDEEDKYEDVDDEDVRRFGQKYAKFKAKHKNIESTGISNDLYYGDIDEEEYYY